MIASTQTNHPLAGARPGTKAPTAIDLATAKLKAAGLRITRPRLTILAALNRRSQPTSIEDLHESLGGRGQGCDLVTVYRCMAAFEEIGLVRRAFLHNGTALYEINLGQPARYHIVCKSTNRVEDLDAETSAELNETLQKIEIKLRARGYEGVGHIVEFFGVAPSGGRLDPQHTALPAVR
ncbi:MAG: transcriptional repressor [Verrucomicrobia bacterium]|nr:transcriptional repressor [Verrucomicrobiota bacterium]